MRKKLLKFLALSLAFVLCVPTAGAARRGEEMVRVGLAYGSGALVGANLENNTGYGSGYRFGYFDEDLRFEELGETDEKETQITVLKAQNTWFYYDRSSGKYIYSNSDNGGTVVGCFHLLIDSFRRFDDAAEEAEEYDGGFVAWIDGKYQVRVGAYLSKEDALDAADELGEGEVVGTSAYAVTVIQTGTDRVLFQFDGGEDLALGIMPDVTGEDEVRTWFQGYKYHGGFRYERIGGGDLTVVSVVDMETYIKGVIPFEMSNDWPLEALKAQAICARSYAYNNISQNKHSAHHFDVCSSTDCQVYRGAGSNVSSYQSTDRTDRAVEETAGEYALYDGTVIEAFYSSSHGGASEDVYNVWGSSREKYPYLCGVEDPYEQDVASLNSYSSWTVRYTASELTSLLQKWGGVNASVESLTLTYSDLGNVIQVKVNYTNGESSTIRQRSTDLRNLFGLPSIRFTINGAEAEPGSPSGGSLSGEGLSGRSRLYTISGTGALSREDRDDLYVISGAGSIDRMGEQTGSSGGDTGAVAGTEVTVSGSQYVFQGSGWGHQLGMSQYGAYAMAERGFDYDEIVEFYFPGVEVDALD